MAKKLTVAEQVIPKTEITIEGETYKLVVTHNMLIEVEDLTGLNTLTGEVSFQRVSAKLLRALLYVSLKRAGAKYTLEQVGEFIHPGNMTTINNALMQAWANSMPQVKKPSDPTEAASE